MSDSAPLILQIGSINPGFDARLAALGEVIEGWTAAGRDRLDRDAERVRIVATSAMHGLDAATMARLPGLRAVASFGVGVDAIDLTAARARGIAVSNTPEVLDECVADHAFALVLATMRRTAEADRFVRAGLWTASRFPLATRVSGKRLGILGLGRIGKVVARRASGFDMAIGYHNRRADPSVAHAYFVSLRELAAWSDVLVVTCPGGEATRGIVDAEVLAALGPTGFLVNVARGSVVDEAALIAALQAGAIAGAGLDVFVDEPRVPDALRLRDDVVATPHVASATRETRGAMEDLTLANVERFLATGGLVTPVLG
ncbi:MAG: 2-hydroxyacid dehydrogenase [Phyllobacteriaceae bacterium]|nr:2-hydroxyacid dehydrogenase [Phyllobacteriaceae bacterium]